MAINFRGLYKSLIPSRFYQGEGNKVLYSLALVKDFYLTRVRRGLEARMPSRTGASGLTLLGDDRGIPRGRAEIAKHYASRLIGWRYPRGHRVRGSAFGLLDQVFEYFGGVACSTIDVKGNYHAHALDGTTSFSYGNAWDWDGIPATPRWGRFWLMISPVLADASGIVARASLDEVYATPNQGVGQRGLGPQDANAIRNLFRGKHPWKPAGTRQQWLIVNLDGTTQTPDATWANWSKNVGFSQVAARYSGWRYISLDPTRNNSYSGNPDLFCFSSQMVDGSTYIGDSSSFPVDVTMPDGSTYRGNPDNFPTNARLIDDGDTP